jgi:hypothetical protein
VSVNKITNKDIALVFERVGGLKAMVKWIKASNRNREKFYMRYPSEIAAVIASKSNAPVKHEAAAANLVTILKNMGDNQRREAAAEEARTGVRMIDGVAYVKADPALNIDGVRSDVPKLVDGVIDARPTRHNISDAAPDTTPQPQPSNDGCTPKPKPDVAEHVVVREQLSPAKAKAAAPAPEPYQPSATELFLEWNGHSRAQWSAPKGW